MCGGDADIRDAAWEAAIDGLWVFLAAGHGDEAERLGWPKDELFAVPPLWARVDLCGAALLVNDREVVDITSSEIRIKTASGATTAFYRRSRVDYGLVFSERLKLIRGNYAAGSEEPELRATEHAVNVYRQNHPNVSLDDAKQMVLDAIKAARAKEPTTPALLGDFIR
jgi:hypothetical protein